MSKSRELNNMGASFKALKWYEWVMITVMILIAGYTMVNSFIDPDSSDNPTWLTVVNFFSAIFGVICIFFTAKASISCCIFGIANTITYAVFLAYWSIYGTLCLELFLYLPMNFIQWYIWAKHRDRGIDEITMTKRLSKWQALVVFVIVAVSGYIYYLILDYVGGTVAFLDAYTVAIGIIAVIICALRYREQYILWLITDVVAVAMYIVFFDPVYLTKKTIYLIMAFVGLYNWYKLNRERNIDNE